MAHPGVHERHHGEQMHSVGGKRSHDPGDEDHHQDAEEVCSVVTKPSVVAFPFEGQVDTGREQVQRDQDVHAQEDHVQPHGRAQNGGQGDRGKEVHDSSVLQARVDCERPPIILCLLKNRSRGTVYCLFFSKQAFCYLIGIW